MILKQLEAEGPPKYKEYNTGTHMECRKMKTRVIIRKDKERKEQAFNMHQAKNINDIIAADNELHAQRP